MKTQTGIWIGTTKTIIITLSEGKEYSGTEIKSEIKSFSILHFG